MFLFLQNQPLPMQHCKLNKYPSISNASVPRKPLKQLSAGLLTYSSFSTPSQETLCSKWYFDRLAKLFGAYSSGYCLGFAPSSLFTNRPKDRVMAPLTSSILCKCNQKISNTPKYHREWQGLRIRKFLPYGFQVSMSKDLREEVIYDKTPSNA